MSHSNHHDHFNTLSAQEIIDDLNACNDKIEAVTGVRPTLFRPPYGEYDDHVISTVRGMGIQPIQWDVDSLDWKDYDAATITQRVTEKVGRGPSCSSTTPPSTPRRPCRGSWSTCWGRDTPSCR